MSGSREIVYRNFVNVMKMQNVLLLIIGKENKGICGLLIMETWPRNLEDGLLLLGVLHCNSWLLLHNNYLNFSVSQILLWVPVLIPESSLWVPTQPRRSPGQTSLLTFENVFPVFWESSLLYLPLTWQVPAWINPLSCPTCSFSLFPVSGITPFSTQSPRLEPGSHPGLLPNPCSYVHPSSHLACSATETCLDHPVFSYPATPY